MEIDAVRRLVHLLRSLFRVWMHHPGDLCISSMPVRIAGIAGLAAIMSIPTSAVAQYRPVVLAMTAGTSAFHDNLGLRDEATFGARCGVGVARRVALWTDFSYSNPLRKSTGGTTDVYGLRMMAEVDLTLGRLRPYALVGGGGVLYSYADQQSNAAGALVLGAGMKRHFGRLRVFVEGKGEMSRVRAVTYSFYGEPQLATERTTQWNRSLLGGLGVAF